MTSRPGRATTLGVVLLSLLLAGLGGCGDAAPARPSASLTTAPFGTTVAGEPVSRYTMNNGRGTSVSFISFGGAVTDVTTPDRDGRPGAVVLGLPTLRDYETTNATEQLFLGAITGRYANFVSGGRFRLGGRDYQLPITNPPNTLHGGPEGFDKALWVVTPQSTTDGSVRASLTHVSPDGDQGFPGTLTIQVTYALSAGGDFSIAYRATTDRDTVLNLSNHLDLNLAGAGSGDVLDQTLQIDADRYTPTDPTQIPTGELAPVQGTPFDFRRPVAIGARLGVPDQQLAIAGGGYDQNWVLNRQNGLQPAVRVTDSGSGRTLEVLTDQPGVQIYTGGFFDGSPVPRFGAFTVETQHFPDSPNHPNFPTTTLAPGQVFESTTIFRFRVLV